MSMQDEYVWCVRRDKVMLCVVKSYVEGDPVIRIDIGEIWGEEDDERVDFIGVELRLSEVLLLTRILTTLADEIISEKRARQKLKEELEYIG